MLVMCAMREQCSELTTTGRICPSWGGWSPSAITVRDAGQASGGRIALCRPSQAVVQPPQAEGFAGQYPRFEGRDGQKHRKDIRSHLLSPA
jgi:hypothetical protein